VHFGQTAITQPHADTSATATGGRVNQIQQRADQATRSINRRANPAPGHPQSLAHGAPWSVPQRWRRWGHQDCELFARKRQIV